MPSRQPIPITAPRARVGQRRAWAYRHPGLAAALAAVTVVMASPARAEQPGDPPRATPEPPGEPASAGLEVLPGAMARGTGRVEGRGFWLGTPDRRFILRYSGFVHLDIRSVSRFAPQGPDTDVFALARRARFALEGTTFGNLDYRVMFDPAVDVFPLDAYLDWRATPGFNLRLGKFKSPFGFERRARAFALLFNERGFPTSLAPNRDTGLFVHGQSKGGFVSYDVAALGGAADLENVNTLRGSPEAAGRLYLQPFRLTEASAPLRHFGLGLSATWGTERGRPGDVRLGSIQTTGRTRFFRYRDTEDAVAHADGARRRWSAHGHWRHARWQTLWEYVYSSQEVRAAEAHRRLAHDAWMVAVSYALTDDTQGFFGILPRRPFDPARGQYGALSLSLRYTDLRIDRRTFPAFADPARSARAARAGAASLLWTLNQNLRAQWDAEAVAFRGGVPGTGDRPSELTLTMRIQAFY